MSHHIHGFIARAEGLGVAAAELASAQVVKLADEFAFLPITEQLVSNDEPAAQLEHVVLITPGSSNGRKPPQS